MPVPPFSLRFPSLYFSPLRYRPRGVGNWSGHIPFACDLISVLRPSVLVELGTHLGESYFAFCQAIAESGTKSKAYAVDTWQGDAHTGAYGDEVFDEVAKYNTSHYGEFSQLMRMLFDEASRRFEPESIELLHIDGLHTYEAVRHDFETWWPRVKPGGIVLLHDTLERNTDFGVWKLLNELSGDFQTAEFRHSNGLGVVLKPGATPQHDLISTLFNKDRDEFDRLQRYYEVCADHLEYRFWLERRNRTGDWDITAQLFWRGEGGSLTEAASIRCAHTLTPEPSRLVLPVPRMDAPPIELRLDLADCPAFFEVHAISVLDESGKLLCRFEADDINDLRGRGLHAITSADETGMLVLDAPAGASFLLPAPEPVIRSLQSGGQVIVEATGLTPFSFASKLATTLEGRLTRQQASLAETQGALDHAQSLAVERLEKLGQYDKALAEAQRLAWTNQAELESTSASLQEALRIASGREENLKLEVNTITEKLRNSEEHISRLLADERTLTGELEQTRSRLGDRERELAELTSRLDTIEASFAWRAIRPLTRLRSQTKP